jgi:hypothetical protein
MLLDSGHKANARSFRLSCACQSVFEERDCNGGEIAFSLPSRAATILVVVNEPVLLCAKGAGWSRLSGAVELNNAIAGTLWRSLVLATSRQDLSPRRSQHFGLISTTHATSATKSGANVWPTSVSCHGPCPSPAVGAPGSRVSHQSHRHCRMRRRMAVAPVKLWFRLTFLLASLADMATTIVAEKAARCRVVGMMELSTG